jgi:polysaccharide biosynthesis protein PslH
MSKPIHLLVVAPAYPYPPIDGHTLRTYNLLRNLSGRFSFDLLTFSNNEGQKADSDLARQLGAGCRQVIFVDRKSLQPLHLNPFQKLKNIVFPHVFSCGEGVSLEMSGAIGERIASGKYELLYCCGNNIMAHAQPFLSEITSIVDPVDSLSLLQASFSRGRGLVEIAASTINMLWANRYERMHLGRARDLIYISPVDRDAVLRNCPDSTIWVVPNGVDTEYFTPQISSKKVEHQLLFTGVMDYGPNHEAMVFFIEHVLPQIRREIQDVTLIIAGRNPLPALQEIVRRQDGIRLTGYVDDMRPYFDSSSVYVSPLRSGAGMKNKVLEAWAMKIPVVATSVSCSGIDISHGKNILVADTSSAIAREVVRLLRDGELRQAIAHGGRHTAESVYSWKAQTPVLENILQHALVRLKSAA